MAKRGYTRRATVLAVLLLVALAYSASILSATSLTGHPHLDGAIGIVLGLYVCSYPAANVVDMLFYRRTSLRQPTSGWAGFGWVTLNGVVLLASWLLIAAGAARLAVR
jgi:hypothetical protein